MAEPETARKFITKNESVIVKAIADVTQQKAAEAMGKSYASYVSTFLSGDQKITFVEMLGLLDGAGLAVHRCSDDSVIVPSEDWRGMVRLAKKYMEGLEI